jgi:hypothetical protein
MRKISQVQKFKDSSIRWMNTPLFSSIGSPDGPDQLYTQETHAQKTQKYYPGDQTPWPRKI